MWMYIRLAWKGSKVRSPVIIIILSVSESGGLFL